MTILVLGDSFGFGAELQDLPGKFGGLFGNDFWDDKTCQVMPMAPSRLAWPQLIADKLCQAVENQSVIGGSNSRIHRLSVTLTSMKAYDLVICAWTELSRIDISWQGRECPVTANNPKWSWIKNYFADHYEYNQELERFFSLILSLQSYFQAKKQPYLFMRSTGGPLVPTDRERVAVINSMSNQIDLDRCLFWTENMCDYCCKNAVPWGEQGHFLEQGHQIVAAHIVEKLTSSGMACHS